MDFGKFMSGLIVGGVLTLLGIAYSVTSDRERQRMMRQGKRMLNRKMKCKSVQNLMRYM